MFFFCASYYSLLFRSIRIWNFRRNIFSGHIIIMQLSTRIKVITIYITFFGTQNFVISTTEIVHNLQHSVEQTADITQYPLVKQCLWVFRTLLTDYIHDIALWRFPKIVDGMVFMVEGLCLSMLEFLHLPFRLCCLQYMYMRRYCVQFQIVDIFVLSTLWEKQLSHPFRTGIMRSFASSGVVATAVFPVRSNNFCLIFFCDFAEGDHPVTFFSRLSEYFRKKQNPIKSKLSSTSRCQFLGSLSFKSVVSHRDFPTPFLGCMIPVVGLLQMVLLSVHH